MAGRAPLPKTGAVQSDCGCRLSESRPAEFESDAAPRRAAARRRANHMATSVKQMLDDANAAVPRVTPLLAREMMTKGNTLVVDVRDAPEVDKSGKVSGSVNISRGMLEFRADPDSPYYDVSFAKDKTIILYCASGGRAALAGKVLKDMGYDRVYNLGAFKAWAESGGALG